MIIVIVVCIAGGLAVNTLLASRRFASQYAAFAAAEAQFETAAYKPAVEANPVRREVGYILSQVLQVPMSDQQRLEMARRGIAHLNDIEGEIDAIKTEGDTVMPLTDALERTASNIGNIRSRDRMREIVALARENAKIIADIRGLSYRSDYYTDEVFERIIDDQGKLTQEHLTYLNDLLPQLEQQFNQRSNLYKTVSDNSKKMQDIARDLGYSAQ